MLLSMHNQRSKDGISSIPIQRPSNFIKENLAPKSQVGLYPIFTWHSVRIYNQNYHQILEIDFFCCLSSTENINRTSTENTHILQYQLFSNKRLQRNTIFYQISTRKRNLIFKEISFQLTQAFNHDRAPSFIVFITLRQSATKLFK